MTSYARAILALVTQPGSHYTAEQLYALLKGEHPKIVLATVYNNLRSLCGENRIRRISVEGQPDRYDGTVRHDHLVCRRCGALSDIALDDLTELLRAQTGMEELTYELQINYLCPDCRASEPAGGGQPPLENK